MNRRTQIIFVATLIAVGAFTRLIPHAPNFTAMGALALYGGWALRKPALGLAVSLGVLFLTDLVIGLYPGMEWTYIGLMSMVLVGSVTPSRMSVFSFAASGLGGSVLFFLLSNIGAWITLDMYTKDLPGLMMAYTSSIPFFGNFVLGTLFFGALALGAHIAARKRIPALA